MRSIVRNMYEATELKYIITSVQSINTLMVVGYFKLSQSINGILYLPLITIGVFSEFYNFLNLYIKSTTNIELKYIHDTNNVIIKQDQIISDFSNKWICFGIVYSKTSSEAKLVFSDTNSKLFSSPIISQAILPSTISTFDVCISCKIEGGNFDHFDGSVSSIKIIYDVDFSSTDTSYFYNEVTQINKTPILSSSFNINNYISNSEYDLGKGFSCQTGYSFFEGVCIDQNNCKNLILNQDIYSSFETGKFYDSNLKKCLNCSSNCLQCSSSTICTKCRPSYKIVNSKCMRCDNMNTCNSSCPGLQQFDPMNQVCVDNFSISSQYLFNLLLSSRLITDNSDVVIVQSPPLQSINDQIVHCYINADNNPITLYSFLGGIAFTTSTVIKQSFTQIPKGYEKTVTFLVLFYGSGDPSKLQVKVNSNIATLDGSYQTIQQNKISCSGSGTQTQSIFKVKFTIQDYQNTLNVEIQSTSSQWGIRNLNIEISKCHPICDSCKTGGSINDCTTCNSNLTKNRFQCMCPYGLYAKYLNCFDSSCVTCSACSIPNCLKCEDITGYCTQCNQGYSIKDGQCISDNLCNNINDSIYLNYCGVSQETGFTHFKQDRIVQYADYWKFYNNDVFANVCLAKQCTPVIGLNNQHTLSKILNNYFNYHYEINLEIELFINRSVDEQDCVLLYDDSQLIFSRCYKQQKDALTGNPYESYIFTENIQFPKNNNQLFFKFDSKTDEYLQNEAQSFSQMTFSYVRCHPLCKSCTESTESSCTDCIDNASMVNGNCQCNDGYYFSLIRFPTSNQLPGYCLKCNSACKLCTGPSPSDCIECQDGYQIVNNLCKYNCLDGQYWDLTSQSCLSCHTCCKTCDGDQNNNCHDCLSGYFLRRNDKSCTIYNVQCQSCTVAINSLCGGSVNNHNDCLNNGWVVKDANTCVQCGKYVNGKCAGEYSQVIIDFCNQLGFLFNYDNNNCSSCKPLISGNCGRNEIKDKCNSYGWKLFDDNTCINCNSNSPTVSQCVCHNTCLKCSRFINPLFCDTCQSSLYLFKNQCFPKCPNGYINDGQICVPCTDKQMPTCVSCYRTCLICNPFQESTISNSCTACSPLTRKLVNGQCKCLDSEDTRESFHECSYENIAVLTATLSNSMPLLNVQFGKQLNIPNTYNPNEFSISLCKFLFTEETLDLIGLNSECSISVFNVAVKLVNSDIFNGDFIYFKGNVLSFASSQVLINTFLNNVVVQTQIVGQTKVLFDYVSVENSCNDISIKYKNIVNHADRGFKSYSWSVKSYLPANPILQTVLENLLQKANNEKRLDLVINKGIIKTNVFVIIRLSFTIKANVISYEDFNLSVKPERKIFLDAQSTVTMPFYRYQSSMLVITSIVKICDPDGDFQINEPLNFSISSQQYPDKDYQNSEYSQQEYQIEFQPFRLNIGQILFKINAKLVSNSFIETQIDFELDILPSQLYVKIVGGNGYFNYKNQVIIHGKLRDNDVQSETEPQGIDIEWKCIDLGTSDNCVSKDQKPVIFDSLASATIEGFTFKPYTITKLTLIGKKSLNRQSADSVTLLFSELDLPPLGVDIVVNDPKKETVNLNDEIFVQLGYNTSVNVDLLSFSGTIQYENKVVGIIKFDYTSLRFQIWNYFDGFKRDSISFQIRFNVFNPEYYMPSMFTSTLNINFPPNKCQFSVTPNAGNSVETKFVMQFQDCEDENQPIYYQFFYYQDSNEFEFEKKYPLQIKRRQLNDKSQNFIIESLLPSGQILILAQAIDSKNGIYNTTVSINVQLKMYDETSYVSLIQQKLDQVNKLQAGNLISDLSIICDDILKRNELKSSSLLNSKKIEIIDILNNLQKGLSSLSLFSTVVDKAIATLSKSGITYNESDQQKLLTQLINSLDESSNLSKLNKELSKEKLKQKLFDSFQVVDAFQDLNYIQSKDKMIELTDKIGNYLFKNILPNEDPINFQGKQAKVFGTQMTEKYACSYFICESNNQIDSSKQAEIFNLKKSTYSNNPYSQDESFLDYTNSLKQQNPDVEISNYPVVTPTISTFQNNKLDIFPKSIILSFPVISSSLQQNMTCISKKKSKSWTRSGCQNVYQQNSNTYLCICDELSPTTVINDLQELFDNQNLKTAFSSDGIQNILNFSNFYKYAAFWLLSTLTFLTFIFYYKGVKLDQFDSKSKQEKIKNFNLFELNYIQQPKFSKCKVVPQNINKSEIEENQKEVKNETLNTEYINNNTYPILNQIENQNDISHQKSTLFKNKVSNQTLNQVTKDIENQNLLTQKKDQITPNSTPQATPETAILESIQLNNESDQQIFNLNQLESDQRKSIVAIPNMKTPRSFTQKIQVDKKIENPTQITTENVNEQQQIIKQRKQRKRIVSNTILKHQNEFKSLSVFKQVIIFHNFFGIFLLFNPDIPRTLRLLIFYVRSIHSLAISVIFDQDYSIVQKIAIAMLNAVSVIIVLKFLELAFTLKNVVFKIFGKIISLVIILGYYYVILSIVSGQEPNKSNRFFITFIIFYSCDILVFSFCSAIFQRYIAHYILKNPTLQGFSQTLYKLIQLKLILISLK